MQADFTVHKHPVLAVDCPLCKARPGVWCHRPSEHKAWDLHEERKRIADTVFIAQHGKKASIDKTESGWEIDPVGLNDQPGQLDLDL